MKTSIYNKKEHIEGYVGSGEKPHTKSDVQKQYEKGNEGNEVTSFGKQPIAELNKEKQSIGDKIIIRDGFDNTGTQGKDSLSDDSYNSKDKNPTLASSKSGTGSSSEDFKTNKIAQRTEDDALNTGI
ncbi:hypothetical protein [Pedobacter jamesrossensis]|uniref:Uncharacterized protein n=1 Tax=Pedobacter jamesrossensis TaxID=1908238 RepID=A0ABV8NRH0_9SPHI